MALDPVAYLLVVAGALSTVAGLLYKQMADRIKRSEDRGDQHDALLNEIVKSLEVLKPHDELFRQMAADLRTLVKRRQR